MLQGLLPALVGCGPRLRAEEGGQGQGEGSKEGEGDAEVLLVISTETAPEQANVILRICVRA